MPKQNTSVTKHQGERVQVVVRREIGIAEQGDQGRIFGLKVLLRFRA